LTTNAGRTTASIIAIGSELLSGQIVNRNAAWLSAKLFALGIDVKTHVTVDDHLGAIIAALTASDGPDQLIFVTGGLGPTSDDLTRQAVADWVKQPLIYHEPSWRHIEAAFARLKMRVAETNRQQCYFPDGAAVLENTAGTANAFALESPQGARVFVLPGPPREVEAVWNDHVCAQVASLVAAEERQTLRSWRTIGKGESHVAELVEPLIDAHMRQLGVADRAGITLAYRAHAPFVETKLRFRATDAARLAPLCDAIGTALAPWLFEIDDEDHARGLALKLKAYKIVDIYDGATEGELQELLAPLLRVELPKPSLVSIVSSWEAHDAPGPFVEQCLTLNPDAELHLAIAGFALDGTWAIGIRRSDDTQTVQEKRSPYHMDKGDAQKRRNHKAVAALALKAFNEFLSGSH
jgi:nicotinamide-nucleotide amidase